MSKVKTIERFQCIDLVFPVCIVTKDLQYFRYFKDGRFETYTKSFVNTSFVFGKLNQECLEEDFSWIRVVIFRHKLITEQEFTDGFNQIIVTQHEKFLEGVVEEKTNEIEETIQIFRNSEIEDPF